MTGRSLTTAQAEADASDRRALPVRHIQRIEQVIVAELGAESLAVARDALARLPVVLANQSDTRLASGGK
ncbi:hypothetical protein [Nocardia salmonicida]|uniref:hypothetical protein n=1 Tax=Nocardia salmonicida TaxID=53431 RepID=UPI003631494F